MDLRQKIRELKLFYTNLSIYGFVGGACILLWLSMGCGPFWPAWVIFGLALTAGLEAIRIGQCAFLENVLSFLRPEWEEEQLKILQSKLLPGAEKANEKESKSKKGL